MLLIINIVRIFKYYNIDIKITYYFFGRKLYLTFPMTDILTSNHQIDPDINSSGTNYFIKMYHT